VDVDRIGAGESVEKADRVVAAVEGQDADTKGGGRKGVT
jgi:hypothetical protein